MKLECGKENLERAILLSGKISGRSLTLPVLNCILLSVKKNSLFVKATNLDLGIEIIVPCKTSEEGIIAVPGNILGSTVASLSESDTVILESLHGNLSIKTPHGKTTIKALPHDDFPTIPVIQGGGTVTLESNILIHGFQSVWYSASSSSVKPELGSVYIHNADKKVFFVATDSFRLAEKSIIKDVPESFGPFLIPFRNVPEILRVLGHSSGDVECSWNEHQIAFRFDKVYLTSRLVEGSFPDYTQIIPKSSTTEVIMLKHDLMTILKKTTIFSDKSNQVRFAIQPSKKRFVVSAENADVGETADTLPAALSGESLDIAFNHKYLVDCFQSIYADSISMTFGGTAKPLVIRGVSDPSFLYLVMPMNK